MIRATPRPHSIRAAAATVALTVLAGVALAGCGGSSPTPLSKTAYEAAMVKIGRELRADMTPVYAATTPQAAGAALKVAQTTFAVAERQLAALVPPAAVKADNATLAKALTQYIDALSPVVRSLEAGNSAAIASITSIKAYTAFQSATKAITAAGYTIS